MAQDSGLAFSFGVVLAMAAIILVIATWADYLPNPEPGEPRDLSG